MQNENDDPQTDEPTDPQPAQDDQPAQGEEGGPVEGEAGVPTATPGSDSSAPGAQPDTDGPVGSGHPDAEEDKLPVTGAEGGVIEYGTGVFAPADETAAPEAGEGQVVVEDAYGRPFIAPAGMDKSQPVSPQNPLPGALRV